MRTVILDVDGVLADFVWGFMSLAYRKFGVPVAVYGTIHQAQWDTFHGLSRSQVSEVWQDIKESPDFWYALPRLATPSDFSKVRDLCSRADVYFVTSRPGRDSKVQTEDWLKSYDIDNPTVIVSSRKGEAAMVVGAHAMLDDKPGNVIFTQYYSPKTFPYIIDRPYNRFDSSVIGSKVARVYSVGEFVDRVSGKVPV